MDTLFSGKAVLPFLLFHTISIRISSENCNRFPQLRIEFFSVRSKLVLEVICLQGLRLESQESCFPFSSSGKVKDIYFIPSSESSAYLKQIKCILSAVKKYRIFSLVMNTINNFYFFTVANRGCFDNFKLIFFQKISGMHRSWLTLRYGRRHVKYSK